jgi:hypothetical protein
LRQGIRRFTNKSQFDLHRREEAPAPRKHVRRASDFRVMIISLVFSSSEMACFAQ